MAEKILIIVLKATGDVLLTTPLIRALKKNKPKNEIYFLTEKTYKAILKYNPYLSGVILRGKNTLQEIRKHRFDTVIDFMHSAISGYYTLFSGAEKRIAFYRPWGFWCYNVMPKYVDRGYSVYDRLQLLDVFGIKENGIGLDLNFGKESEEKVFEFFNRNGISHRNFIITFDITSRRKHRHWQGEKFAELADLIAEKFNAKIVFIPAPDEIEYVKQMMQTCKKRHILCFNMDFLDLAALIKNCKLHVGTTSAPMHIAVSQNTPAFTLYGLKDGPFGWNPPEKIYGYIQDDLNKLPVIKVFESLAAHLKNIGLG